MQEEVAPDSAPQSMSGFGSSAWTGPEGTVKVEVRSVNHRYLDVAAHLPPGWSTLEPRVREMVAGRLHRGHVDVFVRTEESALLPRRVRVNAAVLRQYWEQLASIQEELGSQASLSVGALLALPQAVSVDEGTLDDDAAWGIVQPALQQALEQVVAMRRAEGRQLWEDLDRRLHALEVVASEVEQACGDVQAIMYERLRGRVRQLLASPRSPVEPGQAEDPVFLQRLAQEVALAVDRADISEELVRLRSHVAQMRRLAREEAPGRRMEFLVREMDREASTATAKSAGTAVVHRLIELRSELERIREQILNLE